MLDCFRPENRLDSTANWTVGKSHEIQQNTSLYASCTDPYEGEIFFVNNEIVKWDHSQSKTQYAPPYFCGIGWYIVNGLNRGISSYVGKAQSSRWASVLLRKTVWSVIDWIQSIQYQSRESNLLHCPATLTSMVNNVIRPLAIFFYRIGYEDCNWLLVR